MIYCRQCGAPLNANAAFCTSCGLPIQQTPNYPIPPVAYNVAPVPSPRSQFTFFNSYLSILLLALLLFIPLILGMAATSLFLSPMNLMNILLNVVFLGLPALAIALTARSKGPDLSVGSIMTLSGFIIAKAVVSSGSLASGVILALIVCAAVGALNGVLTVYLKAPAIIVTAVMFFAVWGGCRLLIGNEPVILRSGILQLMSHSIVIPLLLLAAFGGVFVLIALTKLRLPVVSRTKDKSFVYVLAYLVSGVLSALAGLVLLSRTQVVIPYLGLDKLAFAVFIAGAILSSRLFDNRFIPAIISIAAAIIWSIISNLLNILAINMNTQIIVNAFIALIFATLAIVNWATARNALSKTH